MKIPRKPQPAPRCDTRALPLEFPLDQTVCSCANDQQCVACLSMLFIEK